MVLKKSKLGQRNGNSFHSYCHKMRNTRHGCIAKLVIDRVTRTFTEEEKEKAVEHSWQLIPDSSIIGYPVSSNFRGWFWGTSNYRLELYSINKKERWTLPDVIKSSIQQGEFQDDREVIVSVNERKIRREFPINNVAHNYFSRDRTYRRGTSNVSYVDSRQTKTEDQSCCTKKSRRRARHNQHFRGIQRKQQTDFNSQQFEIQNEQADDDVPEIRYEVLYCDKDRKCHRSDHFYNKPSSWGRSKFWPVCRRRQLRMDVSSKNTRLLEEDLELEDMDESDMNVADIDYVHGRRVCLSDYLYSKKEIIGAKSKKIKRKSNIHPNTATSNANSRFYGKDMVIYMKTEETDSNHDDDDSGFSEGSADENPAVLNPPPIRDSFTVCSMYAESVENYQTKFPEKCFVSTNCLPSRTAIGIDGGLTTGDLIIWKKNIAQTGDAANRYLMKLCVHGDGIREEIEYVNSELQKMVPTGEVVTIERVVGIARVLLTEITSWFPNLRCDGANIYPRNPSLLEQVCSFQCDVKTIDEAHQMLENTSVNVENDLPDGNFENVSYCDVDYCQPIPEYCETCFCDIDSDYTGTMMLPCQHFFCNDCWKRYIIESTRNGKTDIKCQAYKCSVTLEDVTLMSFLPCNVYNAWTKRKKENHIESSNKWKWCPNSKCNKVARVIKPGKCRDLGNMSVQCVCSDTWCFSCQKERHWPALCDQREVYYKMLKQNGEESGGQLVDSAVFYVNVKKCPACHYPMEKNGGCQHMGCRCGHGFCWECLGSWSEHAANGLRCRRGKVSETTMELENQKHYPMPIRYYKLSVKCRKTRLKYLSVYLIKRRCAKYASRIQESSRRNKTNISQDAVNKRYSEMQNHLLFVRQMYEILEHIYVMMSHMTKKTRSFSLQRQLDRLEFCICRVESRLHQEEEKPSLNVDTSTRIAHLIATANAIIHQIATVVPQLQKAISTSKQTLLEKPLEAIEYSYM